MPVGGGIRGGQTHSQSPEALFTHVAGLKTVIPSNPIDAKGLLIASIESPDPIIFLEPKRLYNGPFDGHHDRPIQPWSRHELGNVPEGHYTVPLGKAEVVPARFRGHRPGLRDPPLRGRGRGERDRDRRRDHRPADPAPSRHRHHRGLGGQDRPLCDRARGHEDERVRGRAVGPGPGAVLRPPGGPITRVTGYDTPYPVGLEWVYFPGPDRVADALRSVMEY